MHTHAHIPYACAGVCVCTHICACVCARTRVHTRRCAAVWPSASGAAGLSLHTSMWTRALPGFRRLPHFRGPQTIPSRPFFASIKCEHTRGGHRSIVHLGICSCSRQDTLLPVSPRWPSASQPQGSNPELLLLWAPTPHPGGPVPVDMALFTQVPWLGRPVRWGLGPQGARKRGHPSFWRQEGKPVLTVCWGDLGWGEAAERRGPCRREVPSRR